MKGVGRKVGKGGREESCKISLVHFTEKEIKLRKGEAKLSNLPKVSW